MEALKFHAVSVILVHNHPSGDPTPSECDKKITERIYRSGEILGVKLLDHVVIGDQRYISFKEQGMMPEESSAGSADAVCKPVAGICFCRA